ncbi:MAG: D-ornithine 4,5-aminomutase subunit OraE [Bacillota bacterium]
MTLDPEKRLDIEAILDDLENYRPRRRGWTWRVPDADVAPFDYLETSEPLTNSIPLPAGTRSFGGIDPQPDCVITTEIASGRFEDDIRRMRMAAWHGADHMMVIRTAGQSHFDGLIEGTPEGVGGIPITRKQIRATRKALDMIEDEVGRPLNFHSYVSGVAGPEIAVLFAEEGMAGAHQDPQYNVLYRNVNMIRSFVDAAVAKKIMSWAEMLQIDGAHNANATAREAWKVMPELLVQHAINTSYSEQAGMERDSIALSTVPPTAPPAPALRMDLPYAVALRELFGDCRMRAQMNTRYIESDTREATVTHVLNILVSRLTSADIQSTITPDEGRNVPWHHMNVAAVDTAKQALVGMDGLLDMVQLKEDGSLSQRKREIIERAVLFLEEIQEVGGYFEAVAQGYFVDSGYYPERNGDGIARDIDGGVAADSVVPRDDDYVAPVCEHFGHNNLPEGEKPCSPIGGCTLCDPDRIVYIDELDPEDNVHRRLEDNRELRESGRIKPEVEWLGDGILTVNMMLPTSEETARYAALDIAERMGLEDPEVIHSGRMHPAEGTYVEVRGRLPFAVDPDSLVIPEKEELLSEDEIRASVEERALKVVAATVGEDEHSVGMREIIDIKHGGLERYGVQCEYLGTSVPIEKVVDAAIEIDAEAILISTIITHADVHRLNMKRLDQLCREKGIRDRVILVGGGTQISDDMARECGMDAGFGRGTTGYDVASFIVKSRR